MFAWARLDRVRHLLHVCIHVCVADMFQVLFSCEYHSLQGIFPQKRKQKSTRYTSYEMDGPHAAFIMMVGRCDGTDGASS